MVESKVTSIGQMSPIYLLPNIRNSTPHGILRSEWEIYIVFAFGGGWVGWPEGSSSVIKCCGVWALIILLNYS